MLRNKSRNILLSEKVEIANTSAKRARGLMFRRKFDRALIFNLPTESRAYASLHMLFVFFPIDVLFLDGNKRVVDIKRNFKPFSLNYTPKKASKYVVELPLGRIKKTKQGDILSW